MPAVTYGKRGGGSLVDIDSSQLLDAIDAIAAAGADVMDQTAPALAEILVSAVHDVFIHEGAVAGRPKWPELAASTKRKRAKRQPSGVFTILQDTGLLAGSIMPYVDGEVTEAFTNVPYAGFHVSDGPRRKLPKRDFTDIDFDAAQAEAVDLILSQVLAGAAE